MFERTQPAQPSTAARETQDWVREDLAGGGAVHTCRHPVAGWSERPAVLLCHGFVQNISAFSSPNRSLVAHLASAGFAPHVLELPVLRTSRDARLQSNRTGLAYYANVVAPQAIERVLESHPQVAWLGHSMGGLIGVSLPPGPSRDITALLAIASPLLPAIPGGRRMNQALMRCARGLEERGVPLPGRMLARRLHPFRSWLDSPRFTFPLQLWYPLSLHPNEISYSLLDTFGDDNWSVLADLIDLGLNDGECAGMLSVGERVRAWCAPALVIAADRDGLVPLPSARLLYERLGCTQKSFFEVGRRTTGCSAGHIDVLTSRHAEACVWPHITAFLQEHLMANANAVPLTV